MCSLRHCTEAESFSRNFNETTEWKLSNNMFHKISCMFGNLTLDFFTSHKNHQIDKHISWKPDPKAITIDFFLIK